MGFGGGAVDLIGQDDISENGPRAKSEISLARLGVYLQKLRTHNISRHEVRRKLNPVERKPHGTGKGADHEGFRYARRPYQQRMPPTKKTQRKKVQGLFLPDDHR